MEALSKEQLRDIAKDCYVDPQMFCRFFLSHLFPGPVPWVHRGILAILTGRVAFIDKYPDADKIIENYIWTDQDGTGHSIFSRDGAGRLHMRRGRFTLIMMPRGSAKTTIAGIAVPIYDTVYQRVPFGVYLSHAAPHSKTQLNNVKRELVDNARLQAIWPNLRPQMRDDEKWSEEQFETTTGISWVARGKGGQVRGLNLRGNRPKSIIMDDVEDKESVATELQREKTREWFFADVVPALPQMDKSSTITALGTMLHREDLLNTLKGHPEWNVVQFGLRDRAGDPLWPQFMDEGEIEAKRKSYAAIGQLHIYYMEYENKPTSPDTQTFKPEYFILEPLPDDCPVQSAVYVDPAISPKRRADKTAIVVVSMAQNGLIYVREVIAKRGMSEREKVDTYFELQAQYQTVQQGVESTAYQAALVHLMREEMFRKHQYFEIEEVKHKTKKTERISGILGPRYAAGYMRHTKRFPDLETELYDFNPHVDDQPDDCADALAGAVALLDPFAAQAVGDVDLGEDEYEPLEVALGGDWRQH